MISESFHPGWIARENEVDIQLSSFLDTFISFNVLAGEHDIVLDFKPQSLRIGFMLTVAGLALIILCFLFEKGFLFSNRKREQDGIF